MSRPLFRFDRWWRDLRYRAFYGLLRRTLPELVPLGGRIAWTMWPDAAWPGQCGDQRRRRAATFPLSAVADRLGCRVTLLDPSPTGQATWADPAARHPLIDWRAEGLAARAGTLTFAAPLDPAEGSFTIARTGAATMSLPCTTLPELLRQRRVTRVDLLKLDIEGFEYEVIDDLLDRGLAVGQICVEFHHDQLPVGRRATIRCLLRLWRAGYRLVHVHGWDHTFVHRSVLRAG
jgi:FkbM family methyltransferase